LHKGYSLGKEITEKLVIMAADNEQTEDGKDLLETIGTTPIISKQYDPSCMISYATGLIVILKLWVQSVWTKELLPKLVAR